MGHSVRINNGKDGYLYCSVSDNPYEYKMYREENGEEYNWRKELEEIKPEIIEDCKNSGYTESEIETVLSHYETKLGNY